jgi:hypothetical protein
MKKNIIFLQICTILKKSDIFASKYWCVLLSQIIASISRLFNKLENFHIFTTTYRNP